MHRTAPTQQRRRAQQTPNPPLTATYRDARPRALRRRADRAQVADQVCRSFRHKMLRFLSHQTTIDRTPVPDALDLNGETVGTPTQSASEATVASSALPQPCALDAPAPLPRRVDSGGVRYCACCETELTTTGRRGRPPTTCETCRVERRDLLRRQYEEKRTARRRTLQDQTPTMNRPSPVDDHDRPGRVEEPPFIPPGHIVVDAAALVAVIGPLSHLRQALDRAPQTIDPRTHRPWVAGMHRAAADLAAWEQRSRDVLRSALRAMESTVRPP